MSTVIPENNGRPQELIVVPHTHWDREWYLPFQQFRLQLIGLLDEVLQRMEDDPRQRFTLDGQAVAVDDYLEVRPEQRERLTALVKQGRLAVGPWQILLDEFLCSGENIVRNLELGLARSRALGEAMEVGYLPDMFGHAAQVPQILRQFGIEHACVWRGVPAAVDSHAFAWQSPDGTAVRTEYLAAGGYGSAAGLFDDPARVAERATAIAAKLRPWRPDGSPMLAMYGSDHTAPAADLADLLQAHNEAQGEGGMRLRLATLAEYFATQPVTTEGLRTVTGELRSHARANILPGVFSVRAPVKQAMARAERAVERYAEPLSALFYEGDAARFLAMAWHRLIEVSCHDSVTGCGCDETAQQVAARIAEAEQLGLAVRDMTGRGLAARVPHTGHVLLNPTPRPRTALVELDVPGTGPVHVTDSEGRTYPAQELTASPTLLADDTFPYERLPTVLARVHGIELYGQEITAWTVDAEARELRFTVARRSELAFDVAEVKAALAGAGPGGDWRVVIEAEPRRTVAALVDTPALGHTAVRPEPGGAPLPERTVTAGDNTLGNGLLTVSLADDGTFALTGEHGTTLSGAARIVDGGDLGDTYNYAPPAQDHVVDTPSTVTVRRIVDGPLLSAYEIVRAYAWPTAGDFGADGRTEDTEPTTVTTRVELRAGEPFVRLKVAFDNRSDDHRVRLHVPLPRQASTSYGEGQFAVVERGLTAEAGFGEEALPTFPASAFVAAGGVAALLDHATEYELVDEGRELALTLLRSTGQISRNRHAHRDEPAGPQVPTPEAQCRGLRTVDLALLPYEGEWHEAGVLDAAERFRHPVATLPGTAPSATALPGAVEGLRIDGEGVVLSSVRERDGHLEVRVVAQTPAPTTLRARRPAMTAARRVDFTGTTLAELTVTDGTFEADLRPWEIATFRVTATR
ncbi:alpha-mannosidase [Streptomyces sp. SID8379]|uniref:glycoside hydrolase family 38 N-terminal domain-containing protein n=1 Tax=unclassified Streptomyces TaxID=2593676 RepID=UPI00036600DF|nr:MULTISPECIES: glycoside hydrolase family 38 C-terminal domain-containing protein [unclassified Streptomyces]MYW63157.1 alpha-mannosidase [Streptomyces sp. SID8379]